MKHLLYIYVFFLLIFCVAFTTTSNMGLKIPASGDTDYPTSISDSFSLIDQHDHVSGNGVPVGIGGIATNAVTAATIASSAVTTAKIQDGAVSPAKIGSANYQLSSAVVSFFTSGAALSDIATAAAITTNGRPVLVCIIPSGAGAADVKMKYNGTTVSQEYITGLITFVRGATTIASSNFGVTFPSGLTDPENSIPPSSFCALDVVAAGTYTYKIQGSSDNAFGILTLNNIKLFVQEM